MTGPPDSATEAELRRHVELLTEYVRQVSGCVEHRARRLGYGPLTALDGGLDAALDAEAEL